MTKEPFSPKRIDDDEEFRLTPAIIAGAVAGIVTWFGIYWLFLGE